ncbi:hypothetical protein Zmor_021845 [Zophobas morio]|uniref:Acyltransferase 3 domain-containing protein n=1 Tax=Zophobas morio TaxID=2755281 RepID=A0AA38MBR9_9CUCU|nr:hypothetical protein Zmor_021845 [Zophobas morio]
MPPLFHFDDYDRCMLRGDDSLYCSITFQLYQNESSNVTEIWNTIEKISSKPSNYRHDLLRHGVCIPEACPKALQIGNYSSDNLGVAVDSLADCYNEKYFQLGIRGKVVKIHCDNTRSARVVDIYDILFGVFIVLYFIFIAVASLYEGAARYKLKHEYERITRSGYGRVLAAFSLPKNFYRLMDHTPKNPDDISLSCIQGVRFYNMMCVILAHTIMVQFATPVSNPIYNESVHTNFLNAFITNGGYVVQTFFLISGWLLTYKVYCTFEGKQKLRIQDLFSIFILRYLRLTPTLAFVVAFHCTWLIHISRGPFWDKIIGDEYRNCRKNWWTNLLYINNYVNKEEMCLQQTWYLATDTQLFLIFLIVIYVMKSAEKYCKLIIASTTAVGILIPAVISYVNNYDILVRQFPEVLYNYTLQIPQWHIMYSASYSNITGYALGVMFGYFFYKTNRKNVFKAKIYVILWWILSFGLSISVILVAGKMYQDNYSYTRLESALYWGFGKYVFGLGLGIGIYGMTQNIGWFCVWVCRWPPAQVLGRLTFSAYLIHVTLIRLRIAVHRQPLYTNEMLLVHSWLGDVAIAYLSALVVTLFIEMPVSALQKIVLDKRTY